MSAGSDNPRYKLNRKREELKKGRESGEINSEFATKLIELSNALDEEYPRTRYRNPDGEHQTSSPQTIYQYIYILQRWHNYADFDYITATADEVNELAAMMDTGDHPGCPIDDGYARQTVNKFLSAAKKFYHFHDDLDPGHEDIEIFKKTNEPAYDARDLFTPEEIQALRDACDRLRYRALLEMLIYTGQRIRAIQTLRVKDIDADEGYFYLNDNSEGLKDADSRGKKRPLFGARQPMRDWLEYHPRSDDPEAPVFIGDPNNPHSKLDQPMSKRSIRRILARLADDAGISKEANPHKFRHYFVTVMKRDHDLDDSTIKFLLGHNEDSNVMNTTYKHITGDDYIERAEKALGYKEEEEAVTIAPPVCYVCGEQLERHWKSCPNCGEVYSPKANETREEIEESIFNSAVEADKWEGKDMERIREEFKDGPQEFVDKIIEAMSQM